MRSQSIVTHIWFGLSWRYLQDAQTYKIHGSGMILDNVNMVLQNLPALGLLVTLRAALDLVRLRDEFTTAPADARLTDEQAARLRQVMTDLQRTLQAESAGN